MLASPSYYPTYASSLPATSIPCQKQNQLQRILSSTGPIFSAALPILGFFPTLRTPLSLGLGAIRSLIHIKNFVESIQQKDFPKLALHSVQLTLSLVALAFVVMSVVKPHLGPMMGLSMGLILWGADDIIQNVVEITKAIKEKDTKKVLEHLIQLIICVLYIACITSGQLEVLVTCMLLQLALSYYKSLDSFQKGNYLEGMLHFMTGTFTAIQVVPQIKLLQWKHSHTSLTGTLCRNERGLVYVKVDDNIVRDLNNIFGEGMLPPYFGEGKVGAHITVIPSGDLPKDFPISELGKPIKFDLAYYNQVQPVGFSGVDRLSFAAVSAPELDALRVKYGLPAKVHGTHDWHITFGIIWQKIFRTS